MAKQKKEKGDPTLTKEQKVAKAEADDLLEKVLREHEEWLNESRLKYDKKRLTWGRIKPVFDLYQNMNIGVPDFCGCNMKHAWFDEAVFPEGASFREALLDNASFTRTKLSGVDFSRCVLNVCKFAYSDLYDCNFEFVVMEDSEFYSTDLVECSFNRAVFTSAKFFNVDMSKSSFRHAHFDLSKLYNVTATDADFTDANFSAASLMKTDFSHSVLTGILLHASARSNWKIEDVECEYVYWDEYGRERFPHDRDFEKNQFANENKEYPEFSYTFKEAITPFDLYFATYIVKKINAAGVGVKIRVKDLSVHGLNPTMNFIMISGGEKKDEAQELYKSVRDRLAFLEAENRSKDRLIEETTRRADLAEKRLPALLNNAQEVHPGFSEEAFDSFMDRFSNIEDSVALFKNRLKWEQPQHVILWGLGLQGNDTLKQELFWVRAKLQNFLPGKCIVMLDSELGSLPEDSDDRRVYRSFKKRPKKAYIAIARASPEQSDQYLSAPFYHDLVLEPRVAFNECLKLISDELMSESVEDFKLPALHTNQRHLLCINGREIERLRGDDTKTSVYEELSEISKTAWGRIERSVPANEKAITQIARHFGVSKDSLILNKIIPRVETLQRWRDDTGVSKEELAERFGVSSCFFDVLEMRDKAISADAIRRVQYQYCKILDPDTGNPSDSKIVAFDDLIDFEKSKSLSG